MANLRDSKAKSRWTLPEDEGDHIVISGVAGRFPDSDNMDIFRENLKNKVDLISDDDRRWKLDHPEIPQRTGKVNHINKFDAVFFGVHFKQAHTMDPMNRMLLEHAYEAIIDAGINPRQLRGTKTGVFIGACFSESEKTWFYEKLQVNGFGITGCSRAMFANRISYWLGVHGPSFTVDSACSSSLFAIENAYRAMRDGLCDYALVGGSNLCLHPYVSLQFSRLGVLSLDGRSKAFDNNADGYCRSEAIGVIFLQRARDARRIYARVIHSTINCDGYKEQGITFPSSIMQGVLLQDFYKECGVDPRSLAWVEAHGTGTSVGDVEEANALDKVFCTGRSDPLLIGSIKSNLGHSEPASGICSVAKVLISMETGLIMPNLHFNKPREGIKALQGGRIKVVTEVTPWKGGYVGINSFGFGGANAHVLLKSHDKEKVNDGLPSDDLPRVVAISGRTEEAVDTILKDLESRPVDVEYVSLIHDIHTESIPNHLYRGYTVLPARGLPNPPLREVQNYPGGKRQVWFVFSGMGSQWPGMGESLLRLPIFAEAIRKCHEVLKPRGVDIYDILTNKDKSTFDNILNSFVGIAAVQIGLVDVLWSLGIEPDHIIGHSVGELGCAYADRCFSAEQMILSAYSRGLASIETKFIYGSMAAVGMGFAELREICPPDIEIACHNGPGSSTISGPADSMKAFVDKLQANKIFAREVPCSNIAYHSRYIANAGPKLMAYLKQVIPDPKPRSPKWLSTSVPRSEWNKPKARFSSAEYHTNNLLSPVLFEETSVLIPENAITIEIAPHGLLQAILRRSLPQTVTNIGLTQRGHRDNVEVLAQGLGKLFMAGVQVNLSKLYPKVQYPVSRGTRGISSLIKWEHSDDWYVTAYRTQEKITSGERRVEVTLEDEAFEFMGGHIIDGRNLLPATGYLDLVWQTIGMMRGVLYVDIPVIFEDVKFLRATTLPAEGKLELIIMVQKGTGRFEVIDGDAAVVTGYVRITNQPTTEKINPPVVEDNQEECMTSRDVYKELRLRGYHYTGMFRSINRSTINGSKGHILWHNNWVAFMDNMLQMQILGLDSRGLFVPTSIRKIVIDSKYHIQQYRDMTSETKEFPVYVNKLHGTITSGGIEILGLQASAIARRKPAGDPVLEKYGFLAHYDRAQNTPNELARLCTQIGLENHLGIKVKTIEILDDRDQVPLDNLMTPHLIEALGDMPLIQADVILANSTGELPEDTELPSTVTVVDHKKIGPDTSALLAVGYNLLSRDRDENLSLALMGIKESGFVLTRESAGTPHPEPFTSSRGLSVILMKSSGDHLWVLLRKREKVLRKTVVVHVENDKFGWVDVGRKIMKDELDSDSSDKSRVVFVGQTDFENGLLGLVNCLRKEPGGEIVRGILVQDPKAPKFSLTEPLYAKQLENDLAMSVLRPHGTWGSYRHWLLPAPVPREFTHVYVNQLVRGDMSSLAWLEGPLGQLNEDHPDIVDVAYASINFRDVMLASGRLAVEVVAETRQLADAVLGYEYIGVHRRTGKRVMGVLTKAMTNMCVADNDLCWELPNHWSMEDAATACLVYATSYYALYQYGHMKKGEKVLIHSGTGGIGQAAITLALFEGCEVFTTVGTPEKRQFIREHFPQIPDDHIGNSRDCSFEQMIVNATNGKGVDIVLNSLSEDKLLASVRCVGKRGRFLEIGKFDMAANNKLPMECFMREIQFIGVMLDNLFFDDRKFKQPVAKMMQEGLKNGAVQPITRTVYEKDQLEAAFRFMASGKHMGKIMIKVNDEKNLRKPLLGLPRFYCREDRSYIILGGLGGFGLELADWMIMRGAKNLVLTSRNGIKNGYQKSRLALWKGYGTKITIIEGKDASDKRDCQFILATAANMAPVDGIFNLAVVLKDGLWENQTPESFEMSFRAKAWATKTLDELSRMACPLLRYFVVFSSVSCGRGNAGQTNYGMSNSVMERIIERRVAEGLPGLAVQWGAVGDVGLVADMQEDNKELVIGGTLQQRITSCIQELDYLLRADHPIVSSMVVAEKRAGGSGALNMVDTVCNIMGMKDLKAVSLQTSLAEMGMDSMMAVEIKQTLEREFGLFLTAQDIRSLNFAKLQEMQAREAATKKESGSQATDESLTGMNLWIRTLGSEDVQKRDTMYKLDTQNDEKKEEIFLIPGIEGFGSIFAGLAPQIKAPATCLQLGIDEPSSTIPEMADRLLTEVLKRSSKGRREFFLVGYSYGACIAIELARKLEAEGFIVRLVLIDGSPDQLKAIKEQTVESANNEELETKVLCSIMNIYKQSDKPEQLYEELSKCKSWKEKIDTFMRCEPVDSESVGLAITEQMSICRSVIDRLLALQIYDTACLPPIRSPITLIRPKLSAVKYNIAEDYGLNKITRNNVDIYYVEGNHVTMLDNEKVAQCINGDVVDDAESFKSRIFADGQNIEPINEGR